MTRHLFAAASCLALTACAWGPLRDVPEGVGLIKPSEGNGTGAVAITAENQLRKINLVRRLDPHNRREAICKYTNANPSLKDLPLINDQTFDGLLFFGGTNLVPEEDVTELQCAFAAFYTYTAIGNERYQRYEEAWEAEQKRTEQKEAWEAEKKREEIRAVRQRDEKEHVEYLRKARNIGRKRILDALKKGKPLPQQIGGTELAQRPPDQIPHANAPTHAAPLPSYQSSPINEQNLTPRQRMTTWDREADSAFRQDIISSEINPNTYTLGNGFAYTNFLLDTNIGFTSGEELITDVIGGAVAEAALLDPGLILRRNAIQDQILATSQKVCDGFKVELNDKITKANFAFGSIATTLAGLGAIFTAPATSRGLAGASAIISGINAEHNEAYLQSLTVKVITEGIDARREELLEEINGKRFGDPGAANIDYTIEAGLAGKSLDIAYASRPYISLSPYEKAFETKDLSILNALKQTRLELVNLHKNMAVLNRRLDRANSRLAAVQNRKGIVEKRQPSGSNEQDANFRALLSTTSFELRDATEKKQYAEQAIEQAKDNIAKLEAQVKALEELENKAAETIPRTESVGLVPLSQYTMELAIRDAVRFHGACSITAGLEQASQSVDEIRNPGPDVTRKALQNYNRVQEAVNENNRLTEENSIERFNFLIERAQKQKELNDAAN